MPRVREPRWAYRNDVFYDERLDSQPIGQVGLTSPICSPRLPVPSVFCRPTATEIAAGTSRYVLFLEPFGIFRTFFTRYRRLICYGSTPQLTVTFAQLRTGFLEARTLHLGGY